MRVHAAVAAELMARDLGVELIGGQHISALEEIKVILSGDEIDESLLCANGAIAGERPIVIKPYAKPHRPAVAAAFVPDACIGVRA